MTPFLAQVHTLGGCFGQRGVSLLGRHWRIWGAGPGGSEGWLEEYRLGGLDPDPHTKAPGYSLAQVCTPLSPSLCSLIWQYQAMIAILKCMTLDLPLAFSCSDFLEF